MIRNSYNYNMFERTYRKFSMPSKTVPDQTMPIGEILSRYAKGLPITGGSREELWEGDNGIGVPYESLDLVERDQMAEKARQELQDIGNRLKQNADNKNKQRIRGELERELQAEKAAEEAAKSTNNP